MNKALDILGVLSPGAHLTASGPTADISLEKSLIPGVGLGVIAALKMPKHPLLAFFGAETLGQNAYRLYRGQGNDRVKALCNIGQTYAAIAGSLAMPKHPFIGFVVGLAAGIAVTSFVSGSSANRLFSR